MLSMTATITATASPCTRAGCSRPAAGTFSMTDTQPMKQKNMVPTISARQGWNNVSYLLGGLDTGSLAPLVDHKPALGGPGNLMNMAVWKVSAAQLIRGRWCCLPDAPVHCNVISCCSVPPSLSPPLPPSVCALAVAEVSRRRRCSLSSLLRAGVKAADGIIQLGNVSSSANESGRDTEKRHEKPPRQFGGIKTERGPENFMSYQSPALKRFFGRQERQKSDNEEAVQSDETARQSNSWQANRHGYHSEPAATASQGGSLVVKKSHAACSDTLFLQRLLLQRGTMGSALFALGQLTPKTG
ncbi:hypothetical protein INR49_013871 [Caranx melampygus]|nr:hypothetical protein INR49_013871 [Caranx melampygus]